MNPWIQLLIIIVAATIVYNFLAHGDVTKALAKNGVDLAVGETKALEGR